MYTSLYVYIYIYLFINIYIYIHMCVYIYIYTHIHVYICIYVMCYCWFVSCFTDLRQVPVYFVPPHVQRMVQLAISCGVYGQFSN